MTRRMIVPFLFGVAGVAILLSLATWQVRRLAWKNSIVAEITMRLQADPVSVPIAPTPENDRYLQVRESGVLEPGELHIYTSQPSLGVGYRVVVPMLLDDGRRVLLDRGFVPVTEKDTSRLVGPITVEGALDWPRESDNFTDAPDLGKNIWFARDVPLMANALDAEPVLIVARASDDLNQPRPMPPTANIRNNHLEYAVTWFLLALVWAVMTGWLLWRIKRRID